MEKYHKEVEKQHLKLEKEAVKELTSAYEKALDDVKERIKYLQSDEMSVSKIRQLKYQEALESQLGGVLEVLKTDNIITINKYMNEAYKNGFIGSLYCMQKEDVPLALGIDQKKVLSSISKKIEDMTFADREEVNMNDFKTKIKAEITRGIAGGSKYKEIVRNIDNYTKEGINSSYRICRTEMGRVSQEAKYDSMIKAKENGADIVKQWDSTMDHRTRESHARLDGQVRELEEPFEIDGMEAMYPMGFGIASMDINCRCVVLERARWAVEDELSGSNGFTKAVRNEDGTSEIREFNINSYNEFKKDYFKWEKEIEKSVLKNIKEVITDSVLFGHSILKSELSKTDKEVLDYYVMNAGAYDVNYVLRNGVGATENDKRAIEALINAINKGSLSDDIEVYRYISNENVFNDLKIGDIYEDKGFMSTTYSNETDRESNFNDYRIKAVIQAKKGDNAIDVSSIYDKEAYEGEEEREIIFNKGQKIKLIKVETVRDKYDEFTRKIYYFETVK